MNHPKLGVLGGTALLKLDLKDIQEHSPETPFGNASTQVIEGTLPNGHRIVFIPRHGLGHEIPPHAVNYRANIFLMKKLGVTHLLAISAVGSLQAEIIPGAHVVIPDQLFDATKGLRRRTFFDEGLAVHVPMGQPFCPALRRILIQSANQCDLTRVHTEGTYVVIEGPQFSTSAESLFYKGVVPNAAIIGMTAMPEAALAREAGLSYGVAAMPSDYDAWRDGQAVTADEVKAGLQSFGDFPLLMVQIVTEMLHTIETCDCASTLEGFAVHTAPASRPDTEAFRILGVPRN